MNIEKNLRPWGFYEILLIEKSFQVKRIIVYPGKRLSLQYHNHRSEHWTIVNGQALVQVGEDQHILTRNQAVYIAKGVKHRITNIGDNNVEFIESQVGDYFEEDDIVRLEDDFGRI